MTRKKLILSAAILPIAAAALLYGGGFLAQFLYNYDLWQSQGGQFGTAPQLPDGNFFACIATVFRWPSGPQGLGLCVAALAALMFGVLHMGRGSGGVLDKDRNLVYSDKGTYGTAGFMGKADPDTQEAFVAAGQGHTFRFRNQPLSAICVWKYDRQHPNQAIEGAVFQIRYLSGNTSGTGGTVIGTYRTSANGSFTSSFTIVSYHKTLEPYSLHVFLLSCGAGLSQ